MTGFAHALRPHFSNGLLHPTGTHSQRRICDLVPTLELFRIKDVNSDRESAPKGLLRTSLFDDLAGPRATTHAQRKLQKTPSLSQAGHRVTSDSSVPRQLARLPHVHCTPASRKRNAVASSLLIATLILCQLILFLLIISKTTIFLTAPQTIRSGLGKQHN